jgi:hypothetical protein
MELLLNLAWLLLALPAFWLLQRSTATSTGRKFTALQCILALGCILVILFPVVSATDDLRVMRNEMEESPASKRNIRHSSNDKTSAWQGQSPPALAAKTNFPVEIDRRWQPLTATSSYMPSAPTIRRSGRSPPSLS